MQCPAMIRKSRDSLAGIRTIKSSLFASQKRLSQGPALAGNVSSYTSK
jgi:hypothetical protein